MRRNNQQMPCYGLSVLSMPPLHKSFEAQNYDDFNGFYGFKALIALVIFHFGHKQPEFLNITGGQRVFIRQQLIRTHGRHWHREI